MEWLLGRDPAAEPIRQEAAKADPLALAATLEGEAMPSTRVDLAEVRVPCLLVYGERDPAIAPPEATALAGLNGRVHSLGLEESRHFPMLDEAAKFNRLLADFLSLKPGEDLQNLNLKEEWRRRVR